MSANYRWAVLLALAAAACDGGGATEPPEALHLSIADGGSQQGLPGEVLPVPLSVRVARSDGSPVEGVPVRFEPAAGSGTVEVATRTTTAEGIAYATWTLPREVAPGLTVRAWVDGGPEPVVFTAGPLPREHMDLLLSSVPGPIHMLMYDGGRLETTEAFRAYFADSLGIRPFAQAQRHDEMAAFTPGRPPALAQIRWTGARDTVPVTFRGPVTVPVTVWVVRAPFEPLAQVSRAQLDSAAAVWAPAGIRFHTRIVDATGFAKAGAYQGNDVDACEVDLARDIGADEMRINVYYVGGIYDPRYDVRGQGGYCGNAEIVLAASNTRSPWLLGHEIGHAFGLGHLSQGNLMDAFGNGRHVTLGQMFRAHYDQASVINSLPVQFLPELVRNCEPGITRTTWWPLRCLPETYDFP